MNLSIFSKESFIILFSSSLHLQDTKSWVVDDIRITGLQRVSAGSIFAVMPIGLGDEINEESFKEIALSIFETGKFDDIKLGRDGNALLIDIKERPTIDEIFIEGNKQIKTDALLDGLKNSGISEGALYKRSVFESLSVELERQYSSQGKYSAEVEVSTEDLPKNRIKLSVEIDEGESAYLPFTHDYDNAPSQLDRNACLKKLKPILEEKPIIGQHIKFDRNVLVNYDIHLNIIENAMQKHCR